MFNSREECFIHPPKVSIDKKLLWLQNDVSKGYHTPLSFSVLNLPGRSQALLITQEGPSQCCCLNAHSVDRSAVSCQS